MLLVAGTGSRYELRKSDNLLVVMQVVSQKLVIFDADGLVAALGFKKRVESLSPLKLVKDESVGAEVRDVLGNIDVHTIHDGHDDNECGGGDHQAEQRKERAEFVADQRFQANSEGL